MRPRRFRDTKLATAGDAKGEMSKHDEYDSDEDAVTYGDESDRVLAHFSGGARSMSLDWRAGFEGATAYRLLQHKMASVDSNTVATTTANVVELDGIWELGEHAQDNPPAQHTVSTIPAAPHAVMQPRPEKEDVRAAVQSKPKKSKPTAAAFFDDMPAHWSSSTNVHQRQRLANRAQKHAVAPKRAKMETLPMNFPSTEPQSDKLRFAPSWLAPTASTSSSTRGAPQPMEEIVNITPDAPSRQLRAHLEDRDDADLHYDHSHALLTSHPAPRFALTPSKNKPTRVGSLRWRLQKISREAEAVDTYFSMLGNRDEFSLPANGLQDPRNRSKWQVVAEVKEDKTRGGGFFAARLAIEEILGDVTGSATADLGGGGGAAAASGGGRGVCEDIADEPADVDPAPWHRTPRVGDSAVVVFRDQPTIDSLKESLPGQHIKLFDPIWLPYSSQEVGKRCKAIEKTYLRQNHLHSLLSTTLESTYWAREELEDKASFTREPRQHEEEEN